jgi:hypothetical protein
MTVQSTERFSAQQLPICIARHDLFLKCAVLSCAGTECSQAHPAGQGQEFDQRGGT